MFAANYNCLVVLGPTASGKTQVACEIAARLGGGIISADSRQVYRGLNIGTGKDLHLYRHALGPIPYYVIDIADPGAQYYLHDFVRDLASAFQRISANGRLPVICGGTGLYLDALRKDFSFTQIPEDMELRAELELMDKETLLAKLLEFPRETIEHVDLNSKKRIVRGIEVARHLSFKERPSPGTLPYKPLYLGLKQDPEKTRHKIKQRLIQRLDGGMIDEAEHLHQEGLSYDRMSALGLEYKFLALYLQQKINKAELYENLGLAIQQYAKRQMTWFRKMEKEGVNIHWISAEEDPEKLRGWISALLNTKVP